MPPGDAGLERQTLSERVRERLAVAHMRIDDVLSDRDAAPFHEILDRAKDMAELIDQLQAQLAAQQAVVDAAVGVLNCVGHGGQEAVWHHQADGACLDVLDKALTVLDATQTARPEGERW